MVLPGVQALFGFQLIAVFNRPFFDLLSAGERELHLVSLLLVSLAVAAVMAPAAYHRQVEPRQVSERFVTYANRMLMAAMVLLALAITSDLYVIARIILVDAIAAAGIASVAFAAFWSLWWLLPHMLQRAGSH
jgi:hypothetical protein